VDDASNVTPLRHPNEIHDSYVLQLLEHDHVAVSGTRAIFLKEAFDDVALAVERETAIALD
jgi:hypothetical protein